MTNARWFYQGDVDCQQGGFWYRLDNMQYGYADCVRITPCADAGGPDNQFWIESLTVNIPDDKAKLNQALSCCGAIDEYETASEKQRQHIAVSCCVAYGFYDQEPSHTVQIGRKADHCGAGFDPITPETVLRAGSSLRNYVRRQYLAAA